MQALLFFLLIFQWSGYLTAPVAKPVSLFDGKTFKGWQGDTIHTWRIEDGAIIGGSLVNEVPHNEFLSTNKSYGNFILRLKFKLAGTGFVNAGVQLRSQRATNPAYEMIGYQADLGDKYWGCLYDESRRDSVLAKPPDTKAIYNLLKTDGWNDYQIRCEGKRIRLWINGVQTVDYTEADNSIPQVGLIALQIHGGGKAQVWYKDIMIEELRYKK
jgi:hypothetical protein